MKTSFLVRTVILLGAAKALAGLFAFLATLRLEAPVDPRGVIGPDTHALIIVIFGLVAGLLVLGGRRDPRAIALGGFFLSVASVYSYRLIGNFVAQPEGPFHGFFQVLGWLPSDAFMPYLFWVFVRHFPRIPTPSRVDRVVDIGAFMTAALGGFLLAVNLPNLLFAAGAVPEISRLFSAHGRIYDLTLVASMAPAIPFAIARSLRADVKEKRRVRLFVSALVVGVAPIITLVLMSVTIPAFAAWIQNPRNLGMTNWIAFPPLLSIPLTTAYAVLVHHVLDVRLIARKALQYALARYSAMTLATIPLIGLGLYLFNHRGETLAQIFSGRSALLLLVAVVFGAITFRNRQRLLDAVDRRFFREQFDARQILTPLVERIRGTSRRSELADLVANGINRALHLERIALMIEDREQGRLIDPNGQIRPLDASSRLLGVLAASSQALDVDWKERPQLLEGLGEADRNWLLDTGFQLLVPVVAFDGSLSGLIALGEKKSSLPFLREDRQLLSTIAHSAGLALEVQRLRSETGSVDLREIREAQPTMATAQECFNCGRLYLPETETCPACERMLDASLVPYVLPGKFRFERRIGSGGMGVVYYAVDLSLNRPVAVKTMRGTSVEDNLRLRREARAAAAVYHPNLAVIYGVESWQGTPMLMLEFLEKGTLEDLLDDEILPPGRTLGLGISLAGALEKLHDAGILHRDLKPSNIGFSRDGSPKLMDFGIARVQYDVRKEVAPPSSGGEAGSDIPTVAWSEASTPSTESRQVAGTLHYLSPEALLYQRAEPSFDLWSLNVVLFECLIGDRLFSGPIREVMEAIQKGRVPDLRSHRSDCPDSLADYFHNALHLNVRRRPASATQVREALEAVRRELHRDG